MVMRIGIHLLKMRMSFCDHAIMEDLIHRINYQYSMDKTSFFPLVKAENIHVVYTLVIQVNREYQFYNIYSIFILVDWVEFDKHRATVDRL